MFTCADKLLVSSADACILLVFVVRRLGRLKEVLIECTHSSGWYVEDVQTLGQAGVVGSESSIVLLRICRGNEDRLDKDLVALQTAFPDFKWRGSETPSTAESSSDNELELFDY